MCLSCSERQQTRYNPGQPGRGDQNTPCCVFLNSLLASQPHLQLHAVVACAVGHGWARAARHRTSPGREHCGVTWRAAVTQRVRQLCSGRTRSCVTAPTRVHPHDSRVTRVLAATSDPRATPHDTARERMARLPCAPCFHAPDIYRAGCHGLHTTRATPIGLHRSLGHL